MKRIQISLDDGDPLHLGIMPMVAVALGVAACCCGAYAGIFAGFDWKSTAGIVFGLVGVGFGFRAMVREHMDQAAAIEAQRKKREQEAVV